MQSPTELQRQAETMDTLAELSSIFEGIASLRIAQVKNKVLQATEFFNELWQIYTQLRVDSLFRFGRGQSHQTIIDRELYIIITAEGGFSGDIDQKLIKTMLKTYDKTKNDIIVIGHHGAIELAQAGISFKKYFKLPTRDQNINAVPIIKEVQAYRQTTVFYQQYVSLMVQDVKRIEMAAAVKSQAKLPKNQNESTISDANYIFEPSTFAVVDHLERSMMQIAISQLILDSKLAQYASRFRAMTSAHDKAKDARGDLTLDLNRAKRAIKDERIKEIINSMSIAKKHRGAGHV